MKKNEIQEVIDGHFKMLDKLFPRIMAGFEIEDIYNFRTEIKKLRSFFHLLDMEVQRDPRFKITRKMKSFYGYVGVIRNLKLHVQNADNYFKNVHEEVPGFYLKNLETEIEYWQKNAKELIDSHNGFHDDEWKLVSQLPDKLRKSSIKKFIKYVIYEVQVQLLRLDDDETLHSIRKYLQDLFYNWAYVEPYIVSLSPGLHHPGDIDGFIDMLAEFRDKCIDVTLLQTYYSDSCEEKDKPALDKIIHSWNIQKENLKQTVCAKLEAIPIMPIVSGSFSFKRF